MKAVILPCFFAAFVLVACGQSKVKTNQVVQSDGKTFSSSFNASTNDATQSRRLQWNLDTLVGDYERHGRHNSQWDNSARWALEAFAQIRCMDKKDQQRLSDLQSNMVNHVSVAISNGCDDPMIQYLQARFIFMTQEHNSQEHANRFRSLAEAMSNSPRAPIRKFYAALRAAEGAEVGNVSNLPVVHKWRGEAKCFLVEAAHDKNTPAGEIFDAWDALLQDTAGNRREFDDVYFSLEPIVFENWPHDSALLLLKGYFYIEYAWEARGNGFAQSVAQNGWGLFGERLNVAETALNEAWKLNPHDARIARRMITLELGQGRGRKRMELWFQRAMELDPDYYDACNAKLHYLKPQWYGSKEEMLEFASECLNSTNWGGHVPLIVIDFHEYFSKSYNSKEARKVYFKRPEVWSDIKQAFDKFFRFNPRETSWHHNYALYAYLAQQWDDLNRELPLLGKVNYDYFGGREEFEKIVQAAKEHPANLKSP
jgi:hypothetical protein